MSITKDYIVSLFEEHMGLFPDKLDVGEGDFGTTGEWTDSYYANAPLILEGIFNLIKEEE